MGSIIRRKNNQRSESSRKLMTMGNLRPEKFISASRRIAISNNLIPAGMMSKTMITNLSILLKSKKSHSFRKQSNFKIIRRMIPRLIVGIAEDKPSPMPITILNRSNPLQVVRNKVIGRIGSEWQVRRTR